MHWQLIADSLREELAEYGGLLALFEQQQQALLSRDADSVLRLAGEIEDQARILTDCRLRRERASASLATALGFAPDATLRSLLPQIEPDARPLLEALINEVNHLLHRVRRASRQNHSLLSRAVEIHQETLRQLRPDAFTKTYSAGGRISVAAAATPALRVAG